MKSYKINEVEWFIKDEGLIPVLQDFVIPEDSRRITLMPGIVGVRFS